MMVYTLDRLQRDVMARLGENTRPPASYDGLDIPSPVDVIGRKISSLLPEIGTKLIKDAPADNLGAGEPVELVVSMRKMPCGLYAGEVGLPEDYLRLVSVKMAGWSRCVTQVIRSADMEWSRQWSEEPGIAGCPDAPRAYLVCEEDGLKLLLIGSEDGVDSLDLLRVCRAPSPAADGTFHFPSSLYPPLISEIVTTLIPNN